MGENRGLVTCAAWFVVAVSLTGCSEDLAGLDLWTSDLGHALADLARAADQVTVSSPEDLDSTQDLSQGNDLTIDCTNPAPTTSPALLDFGAVPLGWIAGPRDVVLTATGGMVDIMSASLSGPNASRFILQGGFPGRFNLACGQSRTFGVMFDPDSYRMVSASLTFLPSGLAPIVVTLVGRGAM